MLVEDFKLDDNTKVRVIECLTNPNSGNFDMVVLLPMRVVDWKDPGDGVSYADLLSDILNRTMFSTFPYGVANRLRDTLIDIEHVSKVGDTEWGEYSDGI
jgi:hypothetical protein